MNLRALALLILTVLIAQAGAGGMVGNGGDAVLQEFNLRSLQVAAYLKTESLIAAKYGVDPEKFFEAIRRTKLEGEDELVLNGQEVDAINYPSIMKIQVSRTRWAASAARPDAYFVQRRIALHEMLWIYGIDDEGYVVSNPIIAEMERSVGPLIDPDVHRLVMQKLCAAIDREDFNTARGYLTWGLDLNQGCRRDPTSMSPIEQVILTFWFKKDSERAKLIPMIRSLLQFGADPNPSLERVTATKAEEVVDLFFEFGANPNLLNEHGRSLFASVASLYGNMEMTPKIFQSYLNADGDVNLCGNKYDCVNPARLLVNRVDNSVLVEELLKSGKTDWCTIAQGNLADRTIDAVLREYKPLLNKYGIKCPRGKTLFGEERSCELAKAAAKEKCSKENYKDATLLPESEKNECAHYWKGKTGEPSEQFYLAKYICTD